MLKIPGRGRVSFVVSLPFREKEGDANPEGPGYLNQGGTFTTAATFFRPLKRAGGE